jgi:hypothetical protein
LATPVAVQGQFLYRVTNGTVTIRRYTGNNGVVVIPDTITGLPVTAIWDGAFDEDLSLTSVTIPISVTSIGDGAFDGCSSLTNVYFQGNAPSLGGFVFGGFLTPHDPATVYYLPGTTGWGSTFAGIPTALWSLPYPVILNSSVGVRSNQFGFTVSWATNDSVVVEATTDLKNPNWSPVTTNTLSGGTFYFTDALWTNYPSRFYPLTMNSMSNWPASFTDFTLQSTINLSHRRSSFVQALEDYETKV